MRAIRLNRPSDVASEYQEPNVFDLLIQGGQVVDGTGERPPFSADVGITGQLRSESVDNLPRNTHSVPLLAITGAVGTWLIYGSSRNFPLRRIFTTLLIITVVLVAILRSFLLAITGAWVDPL